MKSITRIILSVALGIGAAIFLWHYRPQPKPQPPVLQTNVEPASVVVERAAATPVDTSTKSVYLAVPPSARYHYDPPPTNSAPITDALFWPFSEIDDPWITMDPSEVGPEELERWLADKQAVIIQEATVGFAERQALWNTLKQQLEQ